MPLDAPAPAPADQGAPFDPFAAAGFIKQPDGSYARPEGGLPDKPALGVVPVIDVGAPASPAPKPGEMGSQYRPVIVGPTAKPGTALPAQAVPQQPAPLPPPAPAQAPAPGGAVVPAPPAPAPAPAAPAPAPIDQPFDPFTAGGFERQPDGTYTRPGEQPPVKLPTKAPPAHPSTAADQHPWYQGIWDTVKEINDGLPAAQRDMTHALTLGFDEDIAAIPGAFVLASRKGIPFWEAHKTLRSELQKDREALEQQHPVMSGIGTGVGIGANALLTGGLYSAAKGVLPFVRNVVTGALQGGVGGFGLSDQQDMDKRLQDAQLGGEFGAAGTAFLPLVFKSIGGVWRSLRPRSQIDPKVGQALDEAVGGRRPTFEQPPIRNFPVGTGGATNEPGLAVAERLADTQGDAAAIARRAGQQQALVEASTQPSPGVTLAGRGPTQLASRLMTPSEASGRLQDAFRRAWDVFKREERRLWSTRNLINNPLNINTLKQNVYNAGTSMPLRLQRAISKTPGLEDTMRDLFSLPNRATLLDVNDIRSDLLAIGRTAADPLGRATANRLAANLLRAIERDTNIRGNPAAWTDYQAARDFTRQMWQTAGRRLFQNIIKPDADPELAGRLFRFGPTATGERLPGGVSDVVDALDGIRREWTSLGSARFNPNVAARAQQELGQAAVDYIINSMIQRIAASPTGAEAGELNKLTQWIGRNRGWLVSSRLLSAEQLDLLDAIRETAEMGARSANLRGGRGSETFERLLKNPNPRIIDIFASPLTKIGATAVGGAVGSLFGHWGEIGLLALLGGGFEHVGERMLRHLYEGPSQLLQQRLIEAAQNPDIARDLLKRYQDIKTFSDATKRWLAALSADLGAEASESGKTPPQSAHQRLQ